MSSFLFDSTILLLMLVAAFALLVRYLETVGVFFPRHDMPINPSQIDLPWEDIYFYTPDGVKLNGWFLKNPKAGATLFFAHGNAGNISDRLLKVRFFYELGLNVFIFDYRGYGKSNGRPSESGIYLDAQAAYEYVQSRGDINMDNLIFYGASLGGVVVIDLATHRNCALLVVESSITNAADMARIHYPFVPAFLLNLRFDSLDKVKRLKCLKLFIHSPEDEVVPFWVGKKLFEAAAEPKQFLEVNGGHNDGSITAEPQAANAFENILKAKGLI